MRDEIVEVLVRCKTKIGLMILRIVLFVLCALAVILAMQGGIVFLIAAVILGGAGYFAGSYAQVEYEYTYCEKEIDIDAIYSQARRKHIMTLELSKMEAFVRVESDKMKEFEKRQFIVKDFSSHNKENKDKVYALFYDGGLKILMEPDERLLNAISYVSPRKIFK